MIKIKDQNIILIGFMGTGKTSVAKFLSHRLNMKYVDIDEEIEKYTNMSIKDIFDKKGGTYFREIEKKILLENKWENTIISTGGGIIKDLENRDFIKNNGFVIHLKATFKEILQRTEGTHNRPLLDNIDKFECVKSLWSEREQFYNIADIHINTGNFQLNELVDFIQLIIEHSLIYKSAMINVPVIIKKNIVSKYKTLFKYLKNKDNRIVIITDDEVYKHYKNLIQSITDIVIIKENGETFKSLDNISDIYSQLNEFSINRDDIIVGFGGGTVTDASGFIASTYKRGLKYICIPTTLLGMVDASVGGKTGINFDNIKNNIGVFRQPDLILIDPVFVKTLKKQDYLSGMGEIIKYLYLTNEHGILNDSNSDLTSTIMKCLYYKMDIVEKDEFDLKGIRALLNLGHTFGHLIETISNYEIPHGKAVCDGIYYALKTSVKLGVISIEYLEEFLDLRKKAGFKEQVYSLKDVSHSEIIQIIRKDKKNIGSDLTFVLPVKKDDKIQFLTKKIKEKEFEILWEKII